MTTPTTTDNKTLDLVNRIDTFVWDPRNFQDQNMMLFARGLSNDIGQAYRNLDKARNHIADRAANMGRTLDRGSNTASDADFIQRLSADLVMWQTSFDDNVDALMRFLSLAAQDDAAKDAVAALFD